MKEARLSTNYDPGGPPSADIHRSQQVENEQHHITTQVAFKVANYYDVRHCIRHWVTGHTVTAPGTQSLL